MSFENAMEAEGFFADLFNDNEPMGPLDDASEGSIFNEMVDAIMCADREEQAIEKQNIDIRPVETAPKIQLEPVKGNKDDLFFRIKIDDGEELDNVSVIANKGFDTKLPGICNQKVSQLLAPGQKMVDSQLLEDKQAKDIDSDNFKNENTMADQADSVELSKKFKQLKRPRRDVAYKTILRKCRKFYQVQFNKTTSYLKSKKKEPCSFYKTCIQNYLAQTFEFETSANLDVSFHLGALLYPQEMIRGIESFIYPNGVKQFTPKKVVKRKVETYKDQVNKLHSILYKFTHEKLDKFIAVPELAALFLNYIQNGAGSDADEEDLKFEFDDLTKRCNKILSKCRKTKGVATLFD